MTSGVFKTGILGRTLHSHHIFKNLWGQVPPHQVAFYRGGSNCGDVEPADKLEFHFKVLNALFVAITDHSRDGQQEKSRNHVAFEFFKQMRQNDDWLLEIVGAKRDQIDLAVATQLLNYCYDAATELIMYGDERILDNWDRVEALRQDYPNRLILTGVEANLDIEGNLDTELVHDPRCQVFVMSLHPNYDPEAFRPVSTNPIAYQEALMIAVDRHRPHILAHPGYGCRLPGSQSSDAETEFRHQITGWNELGNYCQNANTAIEINFSRFWNNVCNILVDPLKYPVDDESWKIAAHEIFEQTPLLNDPVVMEQLSEYIAYEGLFVINGDEHHIPRFDAVPGRFEEVINLYGEWVDERLDRFGITHEQIINTWSASNVEMWFTAR